LDAVISLGKLRARLLAWSAAATAQTLR